MKALHKTLSETAIRLSVYSTIFDFGLMLSVVLLQRKVFPIGLSSLFIGVFDDAITYLTLAIACLFAAAYVLKHKENVVKIYTNIKELKQETYPVKYQKMTIKTTPNRLMEEPQKAVMRIPASLSNNDDDFVQRVTNSRNESFIRLNGIWYKSERGKFERIAKPEYR